MQGDGVIRRVAGIIFRPRAILAELVTRPVWMATWVFILIVWAAIGGWLLSTEIGQQALVDERVRVVETFGGEITDQAYEAMQTSPPWSVYVTSGGRLLLTPVATLAAAVGMWAIARRDGARARFEQALAIAVHTSVVLLVGQVIATPLHYVRESLTSPLNLAAVLPLMEEGSFQARMFGSLDLFALWWAGLLAAGTATLTGRRAGRYLKGILLGYAGLAAGVAALIAFMGGA
jgi:hypothetical protein